MILLPSRPLQIARVIETIEPLRWAMLDSKGVGKEPDRNAERKDDNDVENRQQHAGLKVSYGATDASPDQPSAFQHRTPP
jgi:hypothetical protein